MLLVIQLSMNGPMTLKLHCHLSTLSIQHQIKERIIMTTIFSSRNLKTASLLGHAFLIVRSALFFSSALTLTAPVNASSFPTLEQSGSHGAYQIINKAKSNTSASQSTSPLKVQNTQQSSFDKPAKRSSILIQHGSHGAYRVLDQDGVGGPLRNRDYPGFPTLEQRGSHGASSITSD